MESRRLLEDKGECLSVPFVGILDLVVEMGSALGTGLTWRLIRARGLLVWCVFVPKRGIWN